MNIIDNFLESYSTKFDYYRDASRLCAQICETNMEQMGIRAIVTSRAKKVERLRTKLEKRNIKRNYTSFNDINEDIVDFSGVRIALYFPGDLNKVQQFIEANFDVKECKIFPEDIHKNSTYRQEYNKRFSGYWATHYRVYMKPRDLAGKNQKFSEALVEIQIASALMLAWAEVEHDLIYKPISGDLSYEEYQILDELNGMVLAGEIALERLQKAVKTRVTQVGKEFNNHYELAMFLYSNLNGLTESTNEETILGRVDLLYNSLKSSVYNKPEYLKDLLVGMDPDTKNNSVVDQIMGKLRALDLNLYESYLIAKDSDELKHQLEILKMNRENGYRQGEANTLANIGFIYSSKENYDEAINYFKMAVEINREIGSRQGEANQLLNLGSTLRLKGDLKKAMELCSYAMEVLSQIGYKQGEANAIAAIGHIYWDSGKYDAAYDTFKAALEIYKEAGYKQGEANQLNNIAHIFKKKNELELALSLYKEALDLFSSAEHGQGICETYYFLGNLYLDAMLPEEALTNYKKALLLNKDALSQKSKANILIGMGKANNLKGTVTEALNCFKEAQKICNNIEFKSGEEEAISNIAAIGALS